MSKPKYKIGQTIIGRTHHLGDVLPNTIVMVAIVSARYESKYGHWIYCGYLEHLHLERTEVEIYEFDVERKL